MSQAKSQRNLKCRHPCSSKTAGATPAARKHCAAGGKELTGVGAEETACPLGRELWDPTCEIPHILQTERQGATNLVHVK